MQPHTTPATIPPIAPLDNPDCAEVLVGEMFVNDVVVDMLMVVVGINVVEAEVIEVSRVRVIDVGTCIMLTRSASEKQYENYNQSAGVGSFDDYHQFMYKIKGFTIEI